MIVLLLIIMILLMSMISIVCLGSCSLGPRYVFAIKPVHLEMWEIWHEDHLSISVLWLIFLSVFFDPLKDFTIFVLHELMD